VKSATAKIMKLTGVYFTWNEGTKQAKDNRRQLGFIAQDVVDVLPEAVDDLGGHLGINYSAVTSMLVEAFKEQQDQIDEQSDANNGADVSMLVEAVKDLQVDSDARLNAVLEYNNALLAYVKKQDEYIKKLVQDYNDNDNIYSSVEEKSRIANSMKPNGSTSSSTIENRSRRKERLRNRKRRLMTNDDFSNSNSNQFTA
jgi:hypothetical protein